MSDEDDRTNDEPLEIPDEDDLRRRLRVALGQPLLRPTIHDTFDTRPVKPSMETGGVAGLRRIDARAAAKGWQGGMFDRVLEPQERTAPPAREDLWPDPILQPYRMDLKREKNAPKGKYDAAAAKAFWERAFAIDGATPDDLRSFRVRAAWRYVREVGKLLSLVSDDEYLCDALPVEPDPWKGEVGGFRPNKREHHVERVWEVVMQIIGESHGPGDDGRPLGLMPPAIPLIWKLEGGEVDPEYDPCNFDHDPRLHRWMDVWNKITKYLNIIVGSEDDREAGRLGLYGTDDPWMVRYLFPSRLEIFAWEELMVDEALKVYIDHGAHGARKYLIKKHGMTEREIVTLLKIARTVVRHLHAADPEENRALMIARFESIIKRCRKACDLRLELNAMKAMTVVMGVGQVEPEDEAKTFLAIVRQAAALPHAPKKMETIPAEYKVLPSK